MVNFPIYLDNHATTQTDPRVLEVMLPYFTRIYGNPASISHRFGWDAGAAVDAALSQIADFLGAEPREIVFTSGATEANNLAIKGALPLLKKKGNHIVSSSIEHSAVLDPLKKLAREEGYELTLLKPDSTGLTSAEAVANAIGDRTVLVSIMAANNEVGTLNPISQIGQLCHERGVLLHTDATQLVGKLPFNVVESGVGLLSFTAHKIYGPKGVGVLYVRRHSQPVRLHALFDGGGHERGVRSGTLAVPLIIGMAEACRLAESELPSESTRVLALRQRLYAGLLAEVPEIVLNGHPTLRLPGNLNLSFTYVDGEALMMSMRDIAVSSGSACTSANPEPSHVLKGIGLDEDLARASLRFGIGRFNTEEEIDYAVSAVANSVANLRVYSSAWSQRG